MWSNLGSNLAFEPELNPWRGAARRRRHDFAPFVRPGCGAAHPCRGGLRGGRFAAGRASGDDDCVSNEVGGRYISTTAFTGVLLADILKEAGVRRGADQVFTTSVDGWTCGSPIATLTDPGRQAMLAIAMNGEPLPVEHGFPVRMIVPGLYGFVSGTKWITDLELTTFEARQAYWLERGWARRAPIKTMSRIDSPGPFERVSPYTAITGVAWAQTRGIEKVEVRLDHGEWQDAELSTEVNLDTWRMFRLRGRWGPGTHIVEVRATDKTGYTQTADRAAPIPDGAAGWHSVQFSVQDGQS